MSNIPIHVEYNQGLKSLGDLLSGVERPGDFFASGRFELPMPKVEVEGVGVLSFPVPSFQIQEIIQRAARAPYGRGEDTILDTDIRRVWQVRAGNMRVGGFPPMKTVEKLF